MRRNIFAVLALLLVATPLSAQKRAFTPADWYKLTTVSDAALSPDGSRVAFTVTTVNEKENKRHSEVWVVPASGGEPMRFTSPGVESSSPWWSPDGSLLLFTSRRPGGEGRGNTWALRMDRPGGEAFQAEGYRRGSMPANGTFVVFAETPADEDGDSAKSEGPFAKMKPMARPPHASITEPLNAARFDGMHIVDLPYKRNGPGFTPNRAEAREWKAAQIFRQPLGDTAKVQLTRAQYSHRGVTVSPDGRWIAFTADAALRPDSVAEAERDSLALLPYDPVRDEQPRNDTDIYVMPIGGGEPRKVAEHMGNEMQLTWSPDSRRIAFMSSDSRTGPRRIHIVDRDGGTPRNVLGDWQYEPASMDWRTNNELLFTAAVGGRTALHRLDTNSGRITEVLGDRRRISNVAFDRDMRRVAYVATSFTAPTELYIADINGRNERRLTSFNDAVSAEIEWPAAERFTYQADDGLEIEAWLVKPYGYREGQRYPLVLYIHGGPHSAYGENWFDEFHNIAGAGMFVLYTNPRGSSGYGADFTYSTRARWGLEDYEDIMKAVDIIVQRPDVDSTRMGVTGGSYGGFMTAWITTKTDRFKAAQTDRMISNWWSWYGTSDAQGLTEFEFFGKPWDNPELYDELSPIRFARNVTTPTLIVQSEEDHRTPMTDAEQWFVALKKHGVPVELVRYPRSTHDLSRTGEPWLLVDRLGRLRQWFAHWLDAEQPVSADQQ